LNLYAMVGGNPVTRDDAQGLAATPALEAPGDKQIRRLSISRRLANIGLIMRSRIQAASSTAIRDGLSTYIANAVATGVDLALFSTLQPTPQRNQALRYSVAALDALATLHMSTGIVGNWTRLAPQFGVISASLVGVAYAFQADTLSAQAEEQWDPVAVQRLSGHVRSLSRELVQQIMRGHGTGTSWGSTPLRARLGRTAGATAAYAVATVANAVYGGEVPALMQPNVSPAIEAYDGAMGAMIRSGHSTAVHDGHGLTVQAPDPAGLMHGGLSRMFNQVWTYWAGIGIEALAVAITGLPQAEQSGSTRTIVRVARGLVAALTEWRGFFVAYARRGYTSLASNWGAARQR
jgi:insecticidal toxin complex protein TccC